MKTVSQLLTDSPELLQVETEFPLTRKKNPPAMKLAGGFKVLRTSLQPALLARHLLSKRSTLSLLEQIL
jgi:hypothetical protein